MRTKSDAGADDRAFDWLALERIPRVGPLTIAKLVDAFGSPGAALKAGNKDLRRVAGLSERLARSIADYSPDESEIERDLKTLERLGVSVVSRWHDDCPINLRDIYDPPAILFVRGKITKEDSKAVGIVGSRNPSRYGLEMTEQISRGLCNSGVTMVSGLARGIDTACHRTALKAGGRTIGVLGCGIDVVYPRENRSLIEEVVESGAVITEFRPGTPPHATNFYRRNRIVSGLSKGVVVVEAALGSGSLITTNHAVDQNRDVFAVPGNVMNLRSRGPHQLLKQGAGLVETAEDVLEAVFPTHEPRPQPGLFEEVTEDSDTTDAEEQVLAGLDPDPVPIDVLCESLGMEVGKLAGLLLNLELRGFVRQHPGKMFSRIVR